MSGSKALAAREAAARRDALTQVADAWQWKDWTALNAMKERTIVSTISGAQIVTDWLRARAAAAAAAAPTEGTSR